MIRKRVLLLCMMGLFVSGYTGAETIELPKWGEPKGQDVEEIDLGVGKVDRRGWGKYSPNERKYFHEVLPALFERTLVLESVGGDRGLHWIFTGPREGFDIILEGRNFTFYRRYYDSYGFNEVRGKAKGYPSYQYNREDLELGCDLKAITVRVDHKLTLTVELNGKEIIKQRILEDIRRHQIRLSGKKGEVHTRLLQPSVRKISVKVDPEKTRQTMLGWGGIGTPPAYWELSEAGKERWWEYISEYNLLCQREYPVGGVLNESMDNWDDRGAAKAHYYGDNFPNGEVSDFEYNRKIQELGGFVMFEFWDFPEWIGDDENKYARAMVNYCDTAKEKTGQAPRIVGIQNEVDMTEENVKRFVPALRKALDKAGYEDIKIHMHNAGRIYKGINRAPRYVDNPDVWAAIDYSACNMYDYQNHFEDPDAFDAVMREWHGIVKDKPFISTELCINSGHYQTDSYRIALTMGQLYHKNLTLTDAIMICYCWTILNTEQPSFGASRSLFVSSPEDGFFPVPSSRQLRVFGAYSRRIKEGMRRCELDCKDSDLLVTAFKGKDGQGTLVAINRGLAPAEFTLEWRGANLDTAEIADPYHANIFKDIKEVMVGRNTYRVDPGMILTLTNVGPGG